MKYLCALILMVALNTLVDRTSGKRSAPVLLISMVFSHFDCFDSFSFAGNRICEIHRSVFAFFSGN